LKCVFNILKGLKRQFIFFKRQNKLLTSFEIVHLLRFLEFSLVLNGF
jgi:hypothetical protein